MSDYLTVKEFSEIVGLSKQALYNRMDKDLAPYVKTDGAVKMLSAEALGLFNKDVELPSKQIETLTQEKQQLLYQNTMLMEQNINLISQVQSLTEQIKDLSDRFATLAEKNTDIADKALDTTKQSQLIEVAGMVISDPKRHNWGKNDYWKEFMNHIKNWLKMQK